MQPLRTDDPGRVGDYTTLGRLGHGAMGSVFQARSPGGRLVALKMVRAELADEPGFRDRFRQEVAAMRRVGGFWTAAVVDADPDAGAPWVASEYVPGPTLHEYVSDRGLLPVAMARALTAGLAEALRAIHSAGLVHRDLKPANVLLARDGPRVIDFGIAKAVDATGLTATGMFVGTPGFLAPEQIEGRDATPASDVFALGAVVTYAVTGAGPFGGGDAAGLLYRIVHGEPDLAKVPPELRPLLARCLARSPQDRPAPPDLLAEIGTFDTVEWLPDRTAEPRVPATPRPATRPYTVAAVSLPGEPRAVTSRAVFSTSRVPAVLMCVATAVAALISLSISQGSSAKGDDGAALLFFVGFVLLAVPAIRFFPAALRLRRRLEVSVEGLSVGAGARAHTLAWSDVARARVIEDRHRPWLVVWVDGPDAAYSDLGPAEHGGRRVFPIGHERRKAVREREIRELRAALRWYGGTAYDPNP